MSTRASTSEAAGMCYMHKSCYEQKETYHVYEVKNLLLAELSS